MLKVMVVDDERFVRRGIIENTDWLSLKCRVVAEASNGEEGLKKAIEYRPDLIISDIRMPKMDGIEMLRKIREKNIDLKLIFLTAYGEFSYAQSAVKLDAYDYILKPFDDGELEKSIEKLLASEIREDNKANISDIISTGKDLKDLSQYVRSSIEFIMDNYGDDIGVLQIAENTGISDGYLSKIFKKETGISVNNFLTDYRMNVAHDILKNSSYKIYEVANRVGYRDISYFSGVFKKKFGLLPSECR